MATHTDTPPQQSAKHPNPNYHDNVDPTQLLVKEGKWGLSIVQAKNQNRNFTLMTPPMQVAFARVTGEGNLGEKFNKEGSIQKKRDEAKFSLQFQYGLAGMSEEIGEIESAMPESERTLAQQLRCGKKVYLIGRAIMGQVYDNQFPTFAKYIKAAKDDVIKDQLNVEKGKNSGITTENQLKEAMEADDELKAQITDAYRERFIDNTTFMFDNPDDYDETGCRVEEDNMGETKTSRWGLSLKRKVWRRKNGVNKDEADKQLVPFAEKMTMDTWPDLLASMSMWDYNPFSYFDPIGGADGAGEYLDNHTKLDDGTEIVDPFVDPFKNMSSLASCELMFGVYSIAGKMYGVRVAPYKKMTIWRQKEYKKIDSTAGYNRALAGGFTKRKHEADEAAEPDAKKEKRVADVDEEAEMEAMMQ